MTMSGAALLASFFSDAADGTELPPYVSLGARPPEVGTAALDSSDQTAMTLDGFTGVGACRSGVNVVGPDREVHRREVGEIVYVTAYPTAPTEQQLRVKLTIEQSMR